MTKPNTGDVKVGGPEGRVCPILNSDCMGTDCMWYRSLRYEVLDPMEGKYVEKRGDCVMGHFLHILRDTAHFADQMGNSTDKMRGLMQQAVANTTVQKRKLEAAYAGKLLKKSNG